jgi:hypothetical protein
VTTTQVAALFLGRTPHGLRLFTELHYAPVASPDQLLVEMTRPQDPDYSTFWSTGDFTGPVQTHDGVIDVPVSADVHDRPAGMTQEQAALSVQQAIYSVQDDRRNPRPVQFTLDGNPIDRVFGVPTSEPLAPAPGLDTMSLVQLYRPMEGDDVGPSDQIDAFGAASSFEANVPWRLMGPDGPVLQGNFTASGSGGDKLYPFDGVIDVSSLDPGTYTLIVYTDDPSGGAEGAGAFSDSRTITIQ